MDKLHSEYEALQQKLARLKREPALGSGVVPGAAPAAAGGAATGSSTLRPLQQLQAGRQATPLGAALAAKVAAKDAPAASLPPRSTENRLPPSKGGASGAAAAGGSECSSGAQISCTQSDAAAALQYIQFSGRHGGSALCAAAASAFEDAEFVKLCEQSMGGQLQRTKEGATTQSRMLELAGGPSCMRQSKNPGLVRDGDGVCAPAACQIFNPSSRVRGAPFPQSPLPRAPAQAW
jgi:hypothetical protein